MASPQDSKTWVTLTIALIGLIGIIITGYVSYNSGERAAVEQAIAATQTAETRAATPTRVSLIDNDGEPTATDESSTNSSETVSPALPTDTPLPSPSTTSVPPTETLTPLPTITVTPPPTFTPSPVPTPTSAPPVRLEVTVLGTAEEGIQIPITQSGVYALEYVANAYSPWPSDDAQGNRGWATHVQVFHNRGVQWGMTEYGLEGPIEFYRYLGAPDYYLSLDAAIAATSGRTVNIGKLEVGQYLTFVVVDERSQYFDNRGQVDLALVLMDND